MGTRNLTAVVLDGKYRVAQYGQWDGYPDGQGNTICTFIQEKMDLEKFKAALRECEFIDSDEVKALWVECGADPTSDFVGMDVSKTFAEKYPQLSRDTGGGVLELIQNGARKLQSSINFAGDSLFCEWAYVLDLDNNMLEVYKGFNKGPLDPSERFCNPDGIELDNGGSKGEYSPVSLYRKFPLSIATPFAMEKLSKLNYTEDEDGNEIDNPKKPSDYPDSYFVNNGLTDVKIASESVPAVASSKLVDTFGTFFLALAEASDEDLIALREYAKDFLPGVLDGQP